MAPCGGAGSIVCLAGEIGCPIPHYVVLPDGWVGWCSSSFSALAGLTVKEGTHSFVSSSWIPTD
jgi:hypothetical protein